MCGILGIVSRKGEAQSADLIDSSAVISHRGPDDEGLMTYSRGGRPKIWAGRDTAKSTLAHYNYDELTPEVPFEVGFGHRRLSILDLSPAGHQPMAHHEAGMILSFNGEIYNYIEIRDELMAKGHKFTSKTDTEVILHAWQEWGPDCLHRFNGMFAFLLLDYNKNKLYAARDRFGVKPLYYYTNDDVIVLASEIKQIKSVKGYKPAINNDIVLQYLALGTVDHTANTFDSNIFQLQGGHYLSIDIGAPVRNIQIHKWYTLEPKPWEGNWNDAVAHMKYLLTDAVKLRLRSDVTVGSALSGGLDSSSIVCLVAELLNGEKDAQGLKTVTACYEDIKYDEWKFAKEVISKTNATAYQTFPSFQQLENELQAFLWHQDEPTGSTSQFSQWAVFKCASEAGLKVMLDGQGADEQLAGYGGNDIPFYSGLLSKLELGALLGEAISYKKEKGTWPVGFLLGALQLTMGDSMANMLPQKLKIQSSRNFDWIDNGKNVNVYNSVAPTLKENLLRQVYGDPLPSLLRYEDRNSMAWSIESRTPFLDFRLLEFTLGLPERYVYRNGTRKHILREAMKGVLPAAIEQRKDKMGFVTPEELWLKGDGKKWFTERIEYVCNNSPENVNTGNLKRHIADIIDGKAAFSFLPWRVSVYGDWLQKTKSS